MLNSSTCLIEEEIEITNFCFLKSTNNSGKEVSSETCDKLGTIQRRLTWPGVRITRTNREIIVGKKIFNRIIFFFLYMSCTWWTRNIIFDTKYYLLISQKLLINSHYFHNHYFFIKHLLMIKQLWIKLRM